MRVFLLFTSWTLMLAELSRRTSSLGGRERSRLSISVGPERKKTTAAYNKPRRT